MSRLDELHEMRRAIDAEIERELTALNTMATLRDDAMDLLAATRTARMRILAAAAAAYAVSIEDITNGTRSRAVSAARHVAAWLLRDAGMSFSEIGRLFGQDHTSVMYGVARVNQTPKLLGTAQQIRRGLRIGPVPAEQRRSVS